MKSKQPKRFPAAPWVIGLLLVGLGYALAFLLDGAAPSLLVQVASKDWPSTTGIITHSDVIEESHVNDDSSYRSDIRARYQVDRTEYRLFEIYPGHSVLGSSSNIEAVRLSSRYRIGKSVPVYFNPLDPTEAVLETGVHGRTLISLAFAIVPTALGVWLLLWTIRETWRWIVQSVNKMPKLPLHSVDVAIIDPPWQEHRAWQNPIRSIQNLGSFAQLAQVFSPTRAARNEDATLNLDPHPGSISGRVSGTVTLPRSIRINSKCVLRLSCVFSVATGPNDYSDDGFEVLWTHELHVAPRTTRDGVAVEFSFDEVPDDLPESQLPLGGHYVDWQLTLTASSDGAELCYTFSVPVFVTDLYEDKPARPAPDTEALLSKWRSQNTWRPYRAEINTVGDSLVIRLGPWRSGMYQTGGWGGLVAIVLSFFLSLTLLLFANDELVSIVVTGVFGTVGLFVTGLAAYLWIRVVEIRVRPGLLSLRRFVFGRTVQTRVLSKEEILDLTIRFSQLYVGSAKYGETELIDSVHDLKLLNALRRLIVVYLAPT